MHDLAIADGRVEILTFGHNSDRFFQWGAIPDIDMVRSFATLNPYPYFTRQFEVYGIEPKLAVYVAGLA